MRIHEYQAKDLLKRHGILVPEGVVAETPDGAVEVSKTLGGFPVFIKAQVRASGRGKAGGIRMARNVDEVLSHARSILGMRIKGCGVTKVLVEGGIDIGKKYYAAVAIGQVRKRPVVVVSPSGGVDISEVAAAGHGQILELPIQTGSALREFQIRQATYFLSLPPQAHEGFGKVLCAMERIMTDLDAVLVEINPLVLTSDGKLIAGGVAMNFDDNALPFHPEIEATREPSDEDPLESEARRLGFKCVKMEGGIGAIANGGGLSIALMDLIKSCGGQPAGYIDLGATIDGESLAEAIQLLVNGFNVSAIVINIFAGLDRCDRLAESILKIREKLRLNLPVVVRLTGAGEDRARDMLSAADLSVAETATEAARKAVELSRAEQ
jgi:succinyl-CoA synthetase beta subunit